MQLNEVLQLIAAQVRSDSQSLISYANEYTLGGYDIREEYRKWPMGSLWEPEAKILYALVRHFKPHVCAEVGGWLGASATALASAVKANGFGRVISVDNGGDGNTEHGQLIPDYLREYVTLVWQNGQDWLAEQDEQSIGLIFEDASHATELVTELSRLALRKLQPGGLLVNHDAAHDQAIVGGGQIISSPVGRQIRDGLGLANAYFSVYLAEPSDCGLSITVVPGEWQSSPVVHKAVDFGIAPIESAAAPAAIEPPEKFKKPRKPRKAKS